MTEKQEKHIGSSFDDFLEEDGLRAAAEAVALARVFAWQRERDLSG